MFIESYFKEAADTEEMLESFRHPQAIKKNKSFKSYNQKYIKDRMLLPKKFK